MHKYRSNNKASSNISQSQSKILFSNNTIAKENLEYPDEIFENTNYTFLKSNRFE